MNGISGISFRETPKGLVVNVRKNTKSLSAGKKKKRLPYNFKQMSKQISQAKTSMAARPIAARMRAKLSWLYKQLRSGEYGDSEVNAAIIHAAAMERIAKRKVRHLEEEEAAENGQGYSEILDEDQEVYGKNELEKSIGENEQLSEEMMKQLTEEIKKLEEELAEDALIELQDMTEYAGRNMSEEEIKELKQKHRSDEERQLTRADLKYLKMMFERLEQEKKQIGDSYDSQYNDNSSSFFSYEAYCMPDMELAEIDIGELFDARG